jgi:ABC-type phosphate/phosphonate transport system permease subunit
MTLFRNDQALPIIMVIPIVVIGVEQGSSAIRRRVM